MKIKYEAGGGKTQIISDIEIGTVFSGRIKCVNGVEMGDGNGVFLRGCRTVISLGHECCEWDLYDSPLFAKNYKELNVELVVKEEL